MATRRSIILVNPKFQIKVSFFISSLFLILSAAYPIIIYELIELLVEKTNLYENYHLLQSGRGQIISLLVISHLIMAMIMFAISIFMSHKIAGPLFKLNNSLEKAVEGKIEAPIKFRKFDHFNELADSFNSFASLLKESNCNQLNIINEIMNEIENVKDDEIQIKLKQWKEKLQQASDQLKFCK